MNFIGTGTRISGQDLQDAAIKLGIEVAALRAVLQVETGGKGFDSKDRLKVLFEPHIFYKQLGPGAKRDKAVAQGLAYPKQGAKPYPKSPDTRYHQIDAAMTIDVAVALNSASWGLPQIMGFNSKSAGFSSATMMIKSMLKGEREQLFAMVDLLETWKLASALQKKQWGKVATVYNGSGNAKAYAGELKDAYESLSSKAAALLVKPIGPPNFVHTNVAVG
jgi:N-acetylmuramidase